MLASTKPINDGDPPRDAGNFLAVAALRRPSAPPRPARAVEPLEPRADPVLQLGDLRPPLSSAQALRAAPALGLALGGRRDALRHPVDELEQAVLPERPLAPTAPAVPVPPDEARVLEQPAVPEAEAVPRPPVRVLRPPIEVATHAAIEVPDRAQGDFAFPRFVKVRAVDVTVGVLREFVQEVVVDGGIHIEIALVA